MNPLLADKTRNFSRKTLAENESMILEDNEVTKAFSHDFINIPTQNMSAKQENEFLDSLKKDPFIRINFSVQGN